MANRYLVPLEYLVNLNAHSNFEFEGKTKFIAVMYTGHRLDETCGMYNKHLMIVNDDSSIHQ